MKACYTAHIYESLVERFSGLNIPFSSPQKASLEKDNEVSLNITQIDQIIDQISADSGLSYFIESNASELTPISMSLFVVNDDTWKMMKRKPWEEDKMLAMFTIPYCYWSKHKEGGKNPKGVHRWDIEENIFSFSEDPAPKITMIGKGGDFSGFVEERMIKSRHFGLPGSTRLIPNYEFKIASIDVSLNSAQIDIHPMPIENFDYDFSEPARVYYDHGLHLTAPGRDFKFKINRGKATKLRDTVHLFIGTKSTSGSSDLRLLLVDIWLRGLQRFVESRNRS